MKYNNNVLIKKWIPVLMILAVLLPQWARASEYNSSRPDLLEPEHLQCEAAILIEMESGEVIFEKNADAMMYPASTTKILTAYLGLTMTDAERTIVSDTALMVPEDSSKIGLAVGEELDFLDLIYATMLASGNDAAVIVRQNDDRSVS